MSVFNNPAFDDHERVVFCRDAKIGLSAIIAVHSTALGPAAGGVRQWSYADSDAALYDVLRLSQGMSYKNAMADLKFGGGKAVIIKGERFIASNELYERFGEFVDTLNGDYITAEDVGMTPSIMQSIAKRTRYVTGLPNTGEKAGGDPSPKTAYGIFCGIKAAVAHKLKRADVDGVKVAVQGVGNVGYHLCKLLSDAGASLVVADLDQSKVDKVCEEFAATKASLQDILFQDVDVVAPCALGAVLGKESIAKLRTKIVAGGANNQLESLHDGRRLRDAGILYAPDYVINGGGIINVACEYYGDVDDRGVYELVERIGPRLERIFAEADKRELPTNEVADELAKKIIASAA